MLEVALIKTRVVADIIGANDFEPVGCGFEQGGGARQAESFVGLARCAAKRVRLTGFVALVCGIVEERSKLCAAEFGRDVGHRLDDPLEVQIARDDPRHPVERREPMSSPRSEEHTSELQSLMRISYAVFCLKKKK